MGELFIHFGLHKTGTTFLQRNVLPKLRDTTYVKDWQDLLLVDRDVSVGQVLLSNEDLFGNFFLSRNGWLEDQLRALHNLGKLFPEAKLIMSVRHHQSLLLSLYKQYLHEGGTLPFRRFFDIHNDSGLLKWRDLFLGTRIEAIEANFSSPPFIFTQEELQLDLPNVLAALLDYLNEAPLDADTITTSRDNAGVGHYQGVLLRHLNRVNQVLPIDNKITRQLGLNPRALCQNKLGFISKQPMRLDQEYQAFMTDAYDDDWLAVKKYIEHSRKQSSSYRKLAPPKS